MAQIRSGIKNILSSDIASKLVCGPHNYVNGIRTKPLHATRTMEITCPATGQCIGKMGASELKDVDEAVQSAKNAFNVWSAFTARERGKYLLDAARKIRENMTDIVNLEVIDTGKPIWEAEADIAACADSIEYFGGIAATIKGNYVPQNGGSFGMITKEPLGVCGAIGAWNYPFQVASWKAAPALAAGNTMVYKPSPFTPLTAVTLAEIFTSVGIPAGVFNVVQGERECGEAICKHKDIAKISFTGSVATGKKILASTAEGIKKTTMELGGKSPLIVFEDCDIKNAVKGALIGNFLTQGQVCSNCTRVFVHENIFDEFCSEFVKQTKRLKVGDPLEGDTKVGATINADQANKVLEYISSAKTEGASVLCGGQRIILSEPLTSGYYLSPCIITDCRDDMKIVKEEVFGAVACLLKFKFEDEVIKRANDTGFGLAGGVFTRDVQRAHRVASKIQSGTVWINNYNVYPPELPCGGFKMSGFGRECGEAVFNDYTQLKTIFVEMNDVDCPLYSN